MRGEIMVLALCAALLPLAGVAQVTRPAPAPVLPVTEDYFGTKVTDPYRYMEDLKDPQVLAWIKGQGAFTDAVLGSIAPRAALLAKIAALGGGFDVVSGYESYGGREFYEERAPGSDNLDLMVRDRASGATRKLVDVAALRAAHGGAPYAINYFEASPDGAKVAVGISAGGSEDAVMSVYDAATGALVAPSVDRAQFADPRWTDDGAGLFFTRLKARAPDAPRRLRYTDMTVYAWDLKGEPKAVFGAEASGAPPIPASYFPGAATWPGAPMVAMGARDGVHPELDLWTAPAADAVRGTAAWKRLLAHADGVNRVEVSGARVYLLSHKDAPTFQVLTLPLGAPLSEAKVLVAARRGRVLEAISAASDGLYVMAREGVYSRLLRVPLDGGAEVEVPLPFKGSIGENFSDPRRPGVVVQQSGWTTPPRYLAYDAASGAARTLALGADAPGFDAARYETLDLTATAKDGVAVPLSFSRPRGEARPRIVLMYAYGSYGISSLPGFSPRTIALLDQGAAEATCHVRGGGELGEAWRLGGKDANKPNTWRDLVACGETLIAQGLTTRRQLFIIGGSAGGITMGMAMTERPDLFAGVIDAVPMASALRHEFQVNGPANIPEFGSVSDPRQFKNLLAMDSYQHVRDGAVYPPILITTGLNDPRVDSWQPAKLTARLLAANPANTVLLRVEREGGHGIGSTKSQRDAEYADMLAFVFWNAGLPAWAPAVKP